MTFTLAQIVEQLGRDKEVSDNLHLTVDYRVGHARQAIATAYSRLKEIVESESDA